MDPLPDPGVALTLAAGVPVVAYLVQAIGRDALGLPSRLLPVAALVGGVLWSGALGVAGEVSGHPLTLVLQGVLVGQAASGARSWVRAYRPPGAGTPAGQAEDNAPE